MAGPNKPTIFPALLTSLLALLVSLPLAILLLAIELEPSNAPNTRLSPAETNQVEQLLLESAPTATDYVGQHRIHFSTEQLNLLLRYASQLQAPESGLGGSIQPTRQRLSVSLSIPVSARLGGMYLNIEAGVAILNDAFTIDSLRVGRLQIPAPLLGSTLTRLQDALPLSGTQQAELLALLSEIETIEANESGLALSLDWNTDLVARLGRQAQQMLISDADRTRITQHYRLIADIAAGMPADIRAISLNALLAPMFAAAAQRSEAGSDPVAENRTLLQTLAVYVNNEDIERLLGEELAAQIAPAKFIEVRLQRRQDLAQHLTSIAAITASAGADLARMLSTTKEAYDARYRSGFSFSDLTANSVGVKLASLATADADTARLMQRRLANLQTESDYMPAVGNSRDGLSESDFNALYEDRNSAEYRRRLQEIEQLIAERPLFANLPSGAQK